jgi:hypothetical protein
MKQGKKAKARRERRVNAWMASSKMQKDTAAYKKPGSNRK